MPVNREPFPDASRWCISGRIGKSVTCCGGLDRNARPSFKILRVSRVVQCVPMQRREVTMISGSWVISWSATLLLVVGCATTTPAAPAATTDAAKAQITILYDAFGKPSAMQKDWGYAALIEVGGRRVRAQHDRNPDHPPH